MSATAVYPGSFDRHHRHVDIVRVAAGVRRVMVGVASPEQDRLVTPEELGAMIPETFRAKADASSRRLPGYRRLCRRQGAKVTSEVCALADFGTSSR